MKQLVKIFSHQEIIISKEKIGKCLSKCLVLSEEFIEKFQDKVDWIEISYFQELSDDFIEKF